MAFLTGRPPDLSSAALTRLVNCLYSFHSIDGHSIKHLPSYDDRNYYFKGCLEEGQWVEFVFKMYNCLNNLPEVVCGVSMLMSHLYDQGFQGTHQVSARDGGTIGMVTGHKLKSITEEPCDVMDNYTYCVRVVHFVAGETMETIGECVTPKLLFETGQFLGKIDTALDNGFANEAISKRVLANFDLVHFQNVYDNYISSVVDPHRKAMAQQVLLGFKTNIAPNIPTFKRGTIYNDAHTGNIIVQRNREHYEVVAFIDFDDAVNSCYLFELAVLVTDILAENSDSDKSPIEVVVPLIAGYCGQFELSKEELCCLYDAVMTRCCQMAMVSGVQYKNEPWNGYLQACIEPRWKVIELLLTVPKAEVERIWCSAIGKTIDDYT